MVLASHAIFSAYGFWLPNDPRGSWSEFVGAWELFRFGPATKTNCRRSVAAAPHDRATRLAAKQSLKYPPVRFTGIQARAVGQAFAKFAAKSGLTIWACAILPDHVHLVVKRHRYDVEQVVKLLKGDATRELIREKIHPLAEYEDKFGKIPTAFVRGEWKVFLNDETEIRRAIAYVERNPIKEHLPPQRWVCVTPFEGV